MKAAFLNEDGMLETKQTLVPAVVQNGVLVEMKVAAVCRTDLKMVVEGHRDLILPRVLGHEGVGEVIESLNPHFKKGDWVGLYPGIFCGNCPACKSGHTARCESLRIFGFNEDGCFRTLMSFGNEETGSLIRLPGTDYDDTIALIEPLACCLSAANKGPERKGNALIIGAGSVGSILAALLKSEAWERVIIADRVEDRLHNELPEGVETIHASTDDIISCLKNNGWAQNIDFVVPCCPEGLNWPFWEVMRPGGVVSFFSGGIGGGTMLPIDMNAVHYLELSLRGSYGCNQEDFVSASNILAEDRIDLSFFNLYKIPLEEISAGMEQLKGSEIKKVVINRF